MGHDIETADPARSRARVSWRASWRASWAALVVLVVVACAPVLWAVLTRSDRSSGDIALIELRIRDVFSAHPPLTGAYSRYGWSHPGPELFALFAVPYRLLGNDARALRLTALLFNAVVMLVAGRLLWRRGVAVFTAGLLAMGAVVWGLAPHALSDGWNVTVAVLPFLLTIVACWCALCGDRWAYLAAVCAYSFVFQAHIGFGLVLTPLFIVVSAVLLVRWRRGQIAITRRAAILTAIV
ncbi:MAG TPA: hypothetical protein VGM78_04850, partial [Ilumatobacteraceae bacterium]